MNLSLLSTRIIITVGVYDRAEQDARAYISVQLITICAVVKSKCTIEKGNVCTKKLRDSGQVLMIYVAIIVTRFCAIVNPA